MRVMCAPHFWSLQVIPYQSPIPSLICKQELLGGNVPPLVPGQQPLQRYLIEQYHWCVFLVFFLHTTRVSGLYAGSSLSGLAQAGALDLSQNGVGHFGIPRQHMRLYYVSVLLTECLGICGSGHSSNINTPLQSHRSPCYVT